MDDKDLIASGDPVVYMDNKQQVVRRSVNGDIYLDAPPAKHCGYPVGDYVLDCDRDHCTPEERAVIEAAYNDALTSQREGQKLNTDMDAMIAARAKLVKAADALLAARAGREKG